MLGSHFLLLKVVDFCVFLFEIVGGVVLRHGILAHFIFVGCVIGVVLRFTLRFSFRVVFTGILDSTLLTLVFMLVFYRGVSIEL